MGDYLKIGSIIYAGNARGVVCQSRAIHWKSQPVEAPEAPPLLPEVPQIPTPPPAPVPSPDPGPSPFTPPDPQHPQQIPLPEPGEPEQPGHGH